MKTTMLVACAVLAGAAFADKVTLKSGSVLTGKILGSEGEVIKFESDDFGPLEVKKDAVQSLFDAEKKPLEVAAVAPVPKPPETWHGSVNIAYQADRGNTHGNSASVIANLNRRWDDDRVNFDFGYYYSKTGISKHDQTKSKDKIEVEGQYDHFWSKKWYNYVNARYDRDVIQELDRRVKLGAGFGYQWLEKEDVAGTGAWSFNQELGAAYVSDKYKHPDPERAEDYATLRYAHHLTYEPSWAKGLNFFHDFEYLPEVDDWTVYLMKADVGFSTMLCWNIDLLGKVEWDYNSKPSANRRKSDTRVILGLGYKW